MHYIRIAYHKFVIKLLSLDCPSDGLGLANGMDADKKGFRAIKRGPGSVTGPSVPLTGFPYGANKLSNCRSQSAGLIG